MKKTVYRKGDTIRILRPRVVVRVGYPKTVEDYLPEQSREMLVAEYLLRGQTLEQAIASAEVDIAFNLKKLDDPHPKVAWVAAYLRAKGDGFGGRERTIHFEDLSYWQGSQWMRLDDPDFTLTKCDTKAFKPFEEIVVSKRVVKTGTYYPPSGGGYGTGWSEDDYWYDPGGLDDMKTHVIIGTRYGEFVEEDIELVKACDVKVQN